MKKQETDPDILQYIDETNLEWTKLWNTKAKQKRASSKLKTVMILPDNFQEVFF
jgi:ERCC4-related helicase